MTDRKITISRLTRVNGDGETVPTEINGWGDWHDRPLRWAVSGPAGELQKFSTQKEARKYKSLRRRAPDQKTAIHNYVLEG
jgi:hypothetical protein